MEAAVDAAERTALVSSIVARVADFREGQIPRIDAARVLAWCNQFEESNRPTILRETDRLLQRTYLPQATVRLFLRNLTVAPKLVGPNPEQFWRSVGFLRIQQTGASQLDMLALLEDGLREKFSITTQSASSTSNTYLYLDDVLYSGNRIKNDILTWVVANDIRDATVHVVCIAIYTGGLWNAKSNLLSALSPRRVRVIFDAANYGESRRARAKDAEVLWLRSVPEKDANVDKWKATLKRNDWFFARPAGGRGSSELFTSEESRHIVEQAFFKNGAYIWSLSENPQPTMRPLGYSVLETPGFGATLMTYRNCPNNAPLALWWGDPQGHGPISRWTPLLPRLFGAGRHGAQADAV